MHQSNYFFSTEGSFLQIMILKIVGFIILRIFKLKTEKEKKKKPEEKKK